MTTKTAFYTLHELFATSESKEISTVTKSSQSGTTHRLKFFTVKHDSIINITAEVAQIVNVKLDKNGYAVFGGGQMNHRENAVSRVSKEVFFNERYLKHNTLLFI